MRILKPLLILCVLSMSACTEESFRQSGHDMLSGICANAPHCTVNCGEGRTSDQNGRCVQSN